MIQSKKYQKHAKLLRPKSQLPIMLVFKSLLKLELVVSLKYTEIMYTPFGFGSHGTKKN